MKPQSNAVWALILVVDTWHWLSLVVVLAYVGLSSIQLPIIRRQRWIALRAERSCP
jgi:ABC-type sugar transport system permease subunit